MNRYDGRGAGRLRGAGAGVGAGAARVAGREAGGSEGAGAHAAHDGGRTEVSVARTRSIVSAACSGESRNTMSGSVFMMEREGRADNGYPFSNGCAGAKVHI
jgi:hypothetical protein